MPEVDAPFLRLLVERVRVCLGDNFERLYAKHERGLRSRVQPRNPHRLIVLVKRVEAIMAALERGEPDALNSDVVRVTLGELHAFLLPLEPVRNDPAFGGVEATLNTSEAYAHTMALLSAVKFLNAVGNLSVEFMPTPGPDLRVLASDGSPLHAEIKAPQRLIHPVPGSCSIEEAERLVGATLHEKRKQLRGGDSLLVIGGLGYCEETVQIVKQAAEQEMNAHDRPLLVGVAILSPLVIREDYRDVLDEPVRARLHLGLRTALAQNPHYQGRLRALELPSLGGSIQPVILPL